MLGMIVGAGILGIPYAFARAGIFYGLLNLVVVGIFVTIINLQIGEISLRTNGKHQLTGYAEKYLGKFGKELMAFAMVLGIYGAMIAYLIGSGDTLSSLFGGNPLFYTLIYFIVFSSNLCWAQGSKQDRIFLHGIKGNNFSCNISINNFICQRRQFYFKIFQHCRLLFPVWSRAFCTFRGCPQYLR